MNDKEKFIKMMEKIRIGSTILYTISFGSEKTSTLKVDSIQKCSGDGIGCGYCKGLINNMCFKKADCYETIIIEVIDTDFVTIEEMEI